jgi:hypothetical protein
MNQKMLGDMKFAVPRRSSLSRHGDFRDREIFFTASVVPIGLILRPAPIGVRRELSAVSSMPLG